MLKINLHDTERVLKTGAKVIGALGVIVTAIKTH